MLILYILFCLMQFLKCHCQRVTAQEDCLANLNLALKFSVIYIYLVKGCSGAYVAVFLSL